MRNLIRILSLTLMIMGVGGFSIAQTLPQNRDERAEVRFLEGMIDHHQMALDMALDCLEKAPSEDVLALCRNVIDAQSAEIVQMQTWLADWYGIQYAPMPMADMTMADTSSSDHAGHSAGIVTDPPLMMGMMAGFNRLEGVDYEIAWLESMIDHHDDALHMSERILGRIAHEELGEFAQAIIDAQTAEITFMEMLIETLSAV